MEHVERRKFSPGPDGKYTLYDRDGKEHKFQYSVDANEALASLDEDGNQRFSTIDPKKKKDVEEEKPKAKSESQKSETKTETRAEQRAREKAEAADRVKAAAEAKKDKEEEDE